MPTSLTSTYLLPAVLLNPVVILHGFNTFMSHVTPAATVVVSTSQHQWLENLGPVSARGYYLDVHSNEQLCWGYTMLIVVVQILAYGTVSDERVRRKSARAAKAARERKASEEQKVPFGEERIASQKTASTVMNGHEDESALTPNHANKNVMKEIPNGQLSSTYLNCKALKGKMEIFHTEESTPELSSEEEMIL
jgi:hypothetical protein